MIICRELIKSFLHIRYNDSQTYIHTYKQMYLFGKWYVCMYVRSGVQLEAKVRNN